MAFTPKTTISLPQRLEAFAQELVAKGQYRTTDEVVADAFEALEFRNKVNALQAEVDAGMREIETGDYTEGSAKELSLQMRRDSEHLTDPR